MRTDDDRRVEARRLLSLDEGGLAEEAVAVALRIGDEAEQSMEELSALDDAFLEDIRGGLERHIAGTVSEG